MIFLTFFSLKLRLRIFLFFYFFEFSFYIFHCVEGLIVVFLFLWATIN